MTISQLERAIRRQRAAILRREAGVVSHIGKLYQELEAELRTRLAEIQSLIAARLEAGEKVSASIMQQEAKYASVLRQVADQLQRFGEEALSLITPATLIEVVKGAADGIYLIGQLSGLPTRALESLTGLFDPGAPLAELLSGYGQAAVNEAEKVLFLALGTGDNPNKTKRKLRKAVNAASDTLEEMSATRAQAIARTEMLRAYRTGEQTSFQENRHIVSGWRWLCAKQPRTCAACLALDGQVFDVDEPFGAHVLCRCTMVPMTESTPAHRETGEAWLRKQPINVQRKVLGLTQQQLWEDGAIRLDQCVHTTDHPVWGRQRTAKSLKQFRAEGTLTTEQVASAFRKAKERKLAGV